MAGLFIDVQVSAGAAKDAKLVAKLVEVCPVDIFEQDGDGALAIADANLDECTLCDLCVEAAPDGAVKVVKLYE
jgi:NAD-dependent dihydropyrimidine dehydrogenase PreA subunit